MREIRVEVDGRSATAEQLAAAALVNYGHYTTMQIRDRRVRGLDLHLARLDAATRELFDVGLDGDRVRQHLRHALADDDAEATGRITVFDSVGGGPAVMVALREPTEPPDRPRSLRSVRYQRPMAHLKHVGSFGQIYHGIRAGRDGFDDALLTALDGTISETTIANIGFVDRGEVIWPDAPALSGVTMQLLELRLPSRRRSVRLSDVASYDGGFVTNSSGVAPIGRIDDLVMPLDDRMLKRVVDAYASVPWDPI